MGVVELRSDRLFLRRWRPDDRPAFAAMNADPRVMEHFPSVLTAVESDALAGLIEGHFERHGYGLWAVEIPGAVPFAGVIGLMVPAFAAPFTPCVEIGWPRRRALGQRVRRGGRARGARTGFRRTRAGRGGVLHGARERTIPARDGADWHDARSRGRFRSSRGSRTIQAPRSV